MRVPEEHFAANSIGRAFFSEYVSPGIVRDEMAFINALERLFASESDWSLIGPKDGIYRVRSWVIKDIVKELRKMENSGLEPEQK
jgi:hypothetical protein